MYRIITLLSVFTLFLSCKSNLDCGNDALIIKSNDSIISKMESDPDGKKWRENYYEKIKEPILKNTNKESYRLLIYNTMGESSRIYRISKNLNSYKLVYKEFGKEDSYEIADELFINKETELSEKDWLEFQILLKNTGFWNLPVNIERGGLDGSFWVLEGMNPNKNECTNRKYHLVTRWQPLDTMKVMELNYKLIKLTEK